MSDTPPDLTPEQVSPEPSPKKRIVRRAKSAAEAPAESHAAAEVSGTEQGSSPAPRKRTARKKVPELAGEGMESTDAPQKKSARKSSAEIPAAEGTEEAPAKPRRGRPRKKPVEEVPETAGSPDVLIQCDGIAYTTDRCHEHGSIPAWSDAATDAQVVQVTYQRVIARPGLCIYLVSSHYSGVYQETLSLDGGK